MVQYNSIDVPASGMSTATLSQISGGTLTLSFDQYQTPVLEETVVHPDRIEIIYSECRVWSTYPPAPDHERFFKIIYSCKDGKWDVSERIYGKKIPAQDEYYEFED